MGIMSTNEPAQANLPHTESGMEVFSSFWGEKIISPHSKEEKDEVPLSEKTVSHQQKKQSKIPDASRMSAANSVDTFRLLTHNSGLLRMALGDGTAVGVLGCTWVCLGVLGCAWVCWGPKPPEKQLFLLFSGSGSHGVELGPQHLDFEGEDGTMCPLRYDSATFKTCSRVYSSSTLKPLCHDSGLQKSGTQICVYVKVLTHRRPLLPLWKTSTC